MRPSELIAELVAEAHEALAFHGFTEPSEMVPLFDSADPREDVRSLIGCIVRARRPDGRVGEERVFYPDRWFEREHEARNEAQAKAGTRGQPRHRR